MKNINNRDLRLGNIVQSKNGLIQIVRIIATGADHGYYEVPLTQFILEHALGFKRVIFDSEEEGYGTEWHLKTGDYNDKIVVCDDFSIATYCNGDIAHAIGESNNSVHTIQNLFYALTGREMEINLLDF